MALTPIYTPNPVIEYGSEVAWIEAAYNGQLQNTDSTGYLPAVQSLPLGNSSLTKADFDALQKSTSPSAVQSVVGSIASNLGLHVGPSNPTLDLSSIKLGDPDTTKDDPQEGGSVIIDNTQGKTPISNTYNLKTTYSQTVLDEHTNGWSNSTEVMIGNTFAAGFFNKFTASIKDNFSFNGSARTGTDSTTGVERSDSTSVNVPPGKKSLVEVLYSEITQDYPYTATLVDQNGDETVKIDGKLPSKESGNYQIFANDAINYAKLFLAPNSELLGYDQGTPAFLINGVFTGINGYNFAVTQKDITPVGTPAPVPEPASVPEPGFVPGSVVGLALMLWQKLIKR